MAWINRCIHEEATRYRSKHLCNSETHVLDNEIPETHPLLFNETLDRLIGNIIHDLQRSTQKIIHEFHESMKTITYNLPNWTKSNNKAFRSLEYTDAKISTEHRKSTEEDNVKGSVRNGALIQPKEVLEHGTLGIAKFPPVSSTPSELLNLEASFDGLAAGYSSSSESATSSDISKDGPESPMTDGLSETPEQALALSRLEAYITTSPPPSIQALVRPERAIVGEDKNGHKRPSLEQPRPLQLSYKAGLVVHLDAKTKGWLGFGAFVTGRA